MHALYYISHLMEGSLSVGRGQEGCFHRHQQHSFHATFRNRQSMQYCSLAVVIYYVRLVWT